MRNDYKKYKALYTDYYEDTLSYYPFKALVLKFDSIAEQELLLFDSNGVYFEYVFFNVSNNQPRFTLFFDSLSSVIKQEGKPLYLASPDFNKYLSRDTFEVNVYLATPPGFETEIIVYHNGVNGVMNEVITKKVKDDYIVKYIGTKRSDIVNQEDYTIVSELYNGGFHRADTVKFRILYR